jgi:2-C-methyl-D-erythritol 4-phosphate cytidylyltransferase
MAIFSVLILTANPPAQASESAGAYVKIDGREALLRSIELFLNRDNVKQIQLAVLPEMAEESKRKFGGHLGFSGVKMFTAGPKWIDQIVAGAVNLSPDATHVILHDAARPAVPYSDIDALMESAEKSPAVALTASLRNSLVEVDEGGNALAIHPASQYMQLLTPQAYSKAKFHEMAQSKHELHASQLKLLKGSPLNIRAGASDASLLNAMLKMLPKPKIKAPTSPFDEAQW